jgi:hypothetical protein
VTAAAKRTQGACEPKRLSLERELIPEPTWFSERKAISATMYWPVVVGPAGSKSEARTHKGLYGNLGDLALSFERSGAGAATPTAPAVRVVPMRNGANDRHDRR